MQNRGRENERKECGRGRERNVENEVGERRGRGRKDEVKKRE